MRTRLRELRVYTSAPYMQIAIVELHAQSHIRAILSAEVNTANLHTIFVAIARSHFGLTGTWCIVGIIFGCDALIIFIIIAHQGKTIMSAKEATTLDATIMFESKVEVVALLRLQIRIAIYHLHACHIEVHIHLLKGWRTESTCVVGTNGESIPLCHQSQTSSSGILFRCREIVVAKTCHNVQPLQRIVVELRKGVARVLTMRSIVGKLICGEIVVEEICTKGKGVVVKHV